MMRSKFTSTNVYVWQWAGNMAESQCYNSSTLQIGLVNVPKLGLHSQDVRYGLAKRRREEPHEDQLHFPTLYLVVHQESGNQAQQKKCFYWTLILFWSRKGIACDELHKHRNLSWSTYLDDSITELRKCFHVMKFRYYLQPISSCIQHNVFLRTC